jgi:hypothetical protein
MLLLLDLLTPVLFTKLLFTEESGFLKFDCFNYFVPSIAALLLNVLRAGGEM